MNKSFIRYAVSTVIGIEGIFLILTSFVGPIYGEKQYLPYLICGIILTLFAYFSRKKKPESNVFYAKEGFIVVALSWVMLSVLGAIPICVTGEIPNYIDALFEIVSGFTTTGSTIMRDVEILSHVSMFWRLFTHWIGGMGILVFVLAILPTAGGYAIHILRAESPGPSVGKLVSKLSQTAKILYAIYFAMTCIEIILLKLCGMDLFESVILSFATAGTGGFGVVNDSFMSYSSAVQMIAAIFMMLFGINFNIYYYILIGKAKEAFKSEELKWYLGVIALSTIAIATNTYNIYSNGLDAFKHAYFTVCSIITTTGFSSYNFDLWPAFSKTILVTIMFMGAMAGSTGGGIKVSRIVILIKDVKKNVLHYVNPRRVYPIRFEGKRVDEDTVSSIRSYIAIYAFIFIISLLIVSLDNFDYTTNITAVIATINNIGPGLNMVGPIGNFADFSNLSKIVFIFDMLAGRLELLPMLVLFLPLLDEAKKIIKK